MVGTEQILRVFMYLRLNLAREVKVDIGRFISLKAEERFKRDIVTVAEHFLAAFRALFRRQVEA